MQAELKRLHSPDIEFLTYQPEDPGNFCFLLQAMIGHSASSAEESFDFLVCTPSWLADQSVSDGVIFGRHYIVVSKYDAQGIKTAVAKLCRGIEGKNWAEVARKLNEYGAWEFADYRSSIDG